MKSHRVSHRQSILSFAGSLFGPTALGSDISLDRQISPEVQTSHVYFTEDPLRPSPYSLSLANIPPRNGSHRSPRSMSPELGLSQGQDPPILEDVTSGSLQPPSPPAPSMIPSPTTSSITSGDTNLSDYTTTTGTRSSFSKSSRRSSRNPSYFPPFPERKTPIGSFFSRVKDISKKALKNKKQVKHKSLKDATRLRSNCSVTAAQISPPDPTSKRKPTKAEKAQQKNQKKAEKYIKKQTERRLRKYKREMKKRMEADPELKAAREKSKPGKTEKLLKVMDVAKERFWEWLDRREEKRRRKERRTYSAMREERRKSVLLVPVERDYGGVDVASIDGRPRRRSSSRYGSIATTTPSEMRVIVD